VGAHDPPRVSSTTLGRGPTCQDPDDSSEDEDGDSRGVANEYPSSDRVRNGNSIDDDYKMDPFLDHPRGAAAWSRLSGEPGEIVVDWAVSCFQPFLWHL
jgi:hypothetical protein